MSFSSKTVKHSLKGYISSPIFENVITKWTFCVQQFFSAKNSKVAIIKLRVQPFLFSLLLLFFSSLSLFLLSVSFVTVILELLWLKKPAFWRLFTQMTANFVRSFSRKSTRCCQTILPIFQNVSFRSGKRRFRPFCITILLISQRVFQPGFWKCYRQMDL